MNRSRSLGVGVAVVLVASSLGCSTRYQLRDPTGERFPTVTGRSLDQKEVKFPDVVAGQAAVLLIAYDQRTQFDVDRWILGLLQGELKAPLYELPTIPGALAGMAAGFIDDGMRGGIPKEDWGAVVTMYDDADIIAQFTGNEDRRNNARVVVLDPDGVVRFFHDRGYSARLVSEVIALTRTTTATAGSP